MNLREFINSITEGDVPFPRSLKPWADKELLILTGAPLNEKTKVIGITSAINAQEAVSFIDKEIWIDVASEIV